MNIYEICQFLNFYVQKQRGTYFSFDELCEALDRAQMALYSDLYASYGTSQRSQDALSPFLSEYPFTPLTTVSGVIVLPSNSNYLNLLSIYITYTATGHGTQYKGIDIVNKDEKVARLQSQVKPNTTTSPFGEIIAPRFFRVWPQAGYTGTVVYFRRPAKPYLAYTLISGRVPYYDAVNSVQLEWEETFIDDIMIKTLESLGVNMGDDKTLQFAAMKSESNFANINNS